ncbi:MAG: hypothetical protein QXK06_05865 [Candidatus Diapherotrites archaeon]
MQKKKKILLLLVEMNPKKAAMLLAIAAITIIVLAWIALTNHQKPSNGVSEEFAKCLSEKGFVMAGTMQCHACQAQKELFGKSFEFIKFKDCEKEWLWCEQNQILQYPTWVLPDGSKSIGVKTIASLSEMSGCHN